MIVALLPAGGQSRRMGRPKLLLPLPSPQPSPLGGEGRVRGGSETVLERVIRTIRQAGIERILVVANGQVPELANVVRSAGAAVHMLSDETADMRATVEIGVIWIEQTWSPAPKDSWLLVPADHAALDPAVIQQLLLAEKKHPEKSVFVPANQDRRGHPTLIRWSEVPAIRSLPDGVGLNQYFRMVAEKVCEVPVSSSGILRDLDTPEDYAQLLRDFGHTSIL